MILVTLQMRLHYYTSKYSVNCVYHLFEINLKAFVSRVTDTLFVFFSLRVPSISDPYGIGSTVVSSIGLLAVLLVAVIFYSHRKTAIVKAFGKVRKYKVLLQL